MKKYYYLMTSIIFLIAHACLLWNLGIAADEQILVLEYLEANAMIYWGCLAFALIMVIVSIFYFVKKEEI